MRPEALSRILEGAVPGMAWPPPELAERWNTIRQYRAFVANDQLELLAGREHLQGFSGNPEDSTFSPVPIAGELVRYSAALLFAEPPLFTAREPGDQPALDAFLDLSRFDELLTEAATAVAGEGYGALRVSLDDVVPGGVAVDYLPADRVVFRESFGRYVSGGLAVFSHRDSSGTVWRLLEDHSPGVIRRRLFRGTLSRLGDARPLSSNQAPESWRALKPETVTAVLDRPTLIRWSNLPGNQSDLAGLLTLLDELNVAATILRQKSALSRPVLAALESVHSSLSGMEWWRGFTFKADDLDMPGLNPSNYIQVLQSDLQAAEHLSYIRDLIARIYHLAGYSGAGRGGDEEPGRADSGRALALRQIRNDHTRRQKGSMAQRAVSEALGVALALYTGRPLAEPLMPAVQLTDPIRAASEQVVDQQNTPSAPTEGVS